MSRYPKLFCISTKYLLAQPTSVASERVFSSAGNILNSLRNRLSDENVDILIFLAKNNK